MFGCGDSVSVRRIDNDNAAFGCGLHVDIIHADACATDNFKILGAFEDISGNFRRRTDNQRVELRNNLQKFVVGNLIANFDVKIFPKQINAFVGNAVSGENVKH